MNTRRVLGLAVGLAMFAAVQAAPARDTADPQVNDQGLMTVATSVAGLDLSTPDGAKTLLIRLRHAASVACGDQPERWEGLEAVQAYKSCLRTSMDDAVAQVHAPLVTALYRGHDNATASAGGPG
jgi:UrcA family protein